MEPAAASPIWPALRAEAVSLIEAARMRGAVLRLVGSAAVRMHCAEAERLLSRLPRAPKDLDFVCRSGDRRPLRALFEEHGYEIDRDMLVAMEGQRYAYRHRESGLKLDVFVDRLEFCHTIDLRDRLGRHQTTVALEDLLLHKLQIVELTSGDMMDLGVLLLLHPLPEERSSDGGGEASLPVEAVVATLRDDWGFCRTAIANLRKVEAHASEGGYAAFDGAAGRRIAWRGQQLRDAVERAPKTLRWKLRARLGERVQWWQDVDGREGTY